jgi:nucleoside-diphosphate-sugar epimerase
MIIAVTGGSGFIGKCLIKRLIDLGNKVRVLTRSHKLNSFNIEYFEGDLIDPNMDFSSFLHNVDILYHCAGEINDESLMEELHVIGTKRLADKAYGRIRKWVQLSSVGVYGKCWNEKVNENSEIKPLGLYERTKNESDNIVINSNIPFTILRPSNVFGSDMPNNSLREMLNAINKGLFFFIGKKNKFLVSYIHVEEVIEALICCGNDKRSISETFNLSQSITVENMITSFASGLGYEKYIYRFPENLVRYFVKFFEKFHGFPLTTSRVDALTNSCFYDSSKIQDVLGFNFSFTLEERLELFANQK